MTDSILKSTDEAVAQLINGIYENTPQTAEYIIKTLAEGEVISGAYWMAGFGIAIIGMIPIIILRDYPLIG